MSEIVSITEILAEQHMIAVRDATAWVRVEADLGMFEDWLMYWQYKNQPGPVLVLVRN